jgi:hypothetical protein
MKKYILILYSAIIIGIFGLMTPAFAATVATLAPGNVNAVVGKSFTVTINVNPQGSMNYAEKLEIDFPPDILEVTSFNFASNWMALTQSGYDITDNTNGTLTKTAGYPSGFSGETPFGTITFRTKKSGNGLIRIGNTSMAFEANAQTAIVGSGTTFIVSDNTPAPVAIKTKPSTLSKEIKTTPTVQIDKNIVPASTVEPTSSTQAASAGEATSSNYNWVWIIFVIIIAILGWWIYKRKNVSN